MQNIILASASPRRQLLLQQLKLPFTVLSPEVDEQELSCDFNGRPEELALQLARAKAEAVAVDQTQGLIIAADTIVVAAGHILGKPHDYDQAWAMLRQLSGRPHTVITALYLLQAETDHRESGWESTTVFFNDLSDEDIRDYLHCGESMDKAGAYAIQGQGTVLVSRIEGCFYNVVGLPLNRLAQMLLAYGIRVLALKG